MKVVAALATVLLRVLQPQVADLRHASEDRVRKPARVLPLLGVRAQLVRHEPADRLAQLLVLARALQGVAGGLVYGTAPGIVSLAAAPDVSTMRWCG